MKKSQQKYVSKKNVREQATREMNANDFITITIS